VIGTIARKEVLEMWRDGRFRLAAVIVWALLTVALGLGWHATRQAARERAHADRSDRAEWLAQGERNPHTAAHFGRYAFKPVTSLAAFDRGVNSYLGIAVWMEAHWQDAFRFRAAEDATTLQRFGELTAATVLQFLIPLLIVLVAFGQFAGEREQGTLRQLLSLGVRPRDLAAGKMAGVAVALALALVPAVLLGVAALVLSADDASPLRSAGRFLLLALAYLLYLGTMVALSLAISARAPSTRVALLALLGFWAASSLIVPRAAADVASRVVPTPSAAEFWRDVNRDLREGLDGNEPAAKRTADLRARILAQYRVDRIEDLPVNFDGIALQESEEYGNRVFDRHFGHLWNSFERQNRLMTLGAVLGPLQAVRALSMALAGTDFSHHRHFAEAAEAYRRTLVRQMNDEFRDNAGAAGFDYRDTGTLWGRTADFTYEPPSTLAVLRAHLLGGGLLLGWFVLAAAAAVLGARRLNAG
jgi:ABC-2 type transport system permease protein